MAIQWGGAVNHEAVGIDVRHDAYNTNTPSINVYVDYWVRTDWAFKDNQRMNLGGSVGGYWDFYLNTPNGPGLVNTFIGTTIIYGQGQNYNGGPSYNFIGSISGQYSGGSPSANIWWALPPRPANVPTPPGIGIDSVTSVGARIVVHASDGRGSGVNWYGAWVATDPGFANVVTSWEGGTFTTISLVPGTTYYARAQARNGVGYSGYSNTVSFTTGATVPNAPGSLAFNGVTQTTANLTFTQPNNGGSVISTFEIQYATNSGFTAGVKSYTDPTSPANLEDLVPGTQYWARVRALNGVGPSPWTSAVTFTTLAGTPEIILPAEGAILKDGKMSVKIKALGIAAGRTITVEASKVATFASGVITTTSSPTGASSNNEYTVTSDVAYLDSATWYVRAKVTNTATGYVTPWSPTVSFGQSHAPSATLVSPVTGSMAKYAASTPFQFRFVDEASASNDVMSAYQLVIENNATGASIYNSGKVAATTTPANNLVTVTRPIATSLKNVTMRWRVMVWDKGGTPSAWTGYALFTLSDPPTVAVVTPAPSLPVDNGAPTFAWSFAAPSGGTQAGAVVRVFDSANNELVWTGTVTGATKSITPPVVILMNAKSYYFTLDVRDSYGLESSATANFTTSYQSPDVISYSIDGSGADALGYNLVTWVNANPDSLFAHWKVYRQTAPSSTWELVATIPNQNIREYRDYMLKAGDSYSYSVTQAANRSGTILEGTVGYNMKDRALAPTIRNLIPNASFETNTTGWSATHGAATVTRVTGYPQMGGRVGNAISEMIVTTANRYSTMQGPTIAVTPGKWYGLICWAACDTATGRKLVLAPQMVATSGSTYPTHNVDSSQAGFYAGRNFKVVTQAPADGTGIRPRLQLDAGSGNLLPVGARVWSDGWLLVEGTTQAEVEAIVNSPFFDGSMGAPAGGFETGWEGTPFASVSYLRELEMEPEVRKFYADLTHYWIVNLDSPNTSVRLQGVNSDDSTLEFETASFNIAGRGRHVDYGDELGYTGSITCQVRGAGRPNKFREDIETLRRQQETYYYRTPFGRIFQVALGDIGWSPLAGVGVAEMGTLTIPYQEVN